MTQVYMPYSDFTMTARCLDNKRLNKQITEAKQVFTFVEYGYGFQGNPSPYKMWEGCGNAIGLYILALYSEWQNRWFTKQRGGNKEHKAGEFVLYDRNWNAVKDIVYPKWYTDEKVFSSYRSALLYKDFDWYSKFGWSEAPAVPVKIDKKGNVTLPYYYGI